MNIEPLQKQWVEFTLSLDRLIAMAKKAKCPKLNTRQELSEADWNIARDIFTSSQAIQVSPAACKEMC